MAGSTVSRTTHFALHRTGLQAPGGESTEPVPPPDGNSGPGSERSQALFAVQAVWLGALIPKRWAKRSVTRNAIKRQIYTVSQQFETRLPMAAHVVRLRAGFDRKQFVSAVSPALKQAVRAELQQLFAGARA